VSCSKLIFVKKEEIEEYSNYTKKNVLALDLKSDTVKLKGSKPRLMNGLALFLNLELCMFRFLQST